MSVVLRCPTCGTTQNHSGECDACSETDVRYFCTNHSPGVWLTDSRCTACGAKFGDAPTIRPERDHPDAVTCHACAAALPVQSPGRRPGARFRRDRGPADRTIRRRGPSLRRCLLTCSRRAARGRGVEDPPCVIQSLWPHHGRPAVLPRARPPGGLSGQAFCGVSIVAFALSGCHLYLVCRVHAGPRLVVEAHAISELRAHTRPRSAKSSDQ